MNASAIRAIQTFQPRQRPGQVSSLNADVHDKASLLAAAVEMVDGLGLQIISVEADASRNNRIQVVHSAACAALEGVEIHRQPGYSVWTANRFGVEIRWVAQHVEAA